MSDSWFTDVEDVAYSVIEYIPLVGTVYSVKRAIIAYSQGDWKRHWQSVANFAESAVRDIVLLGEIGEPQTAVIIHTMAEAFTDKVIEKLFDDDDAAVTPEFKVTKALDKSLGHVVVAGSEETSKKEAERLFTGRAKGLHRFHGAVFNGILKHPRYAPNGEKIQLSLPQGFYENAPCQFMWRWTIDASGTPNRPEFTFGRLKISPGVPTTFGLNSRKGVGWQGHDFSGSITNSSTLDVKTTIGETPVSFSMTRRKGT